MDDGRQAFGNVGLSGSDRDGVLEQDRLDLAGVVRGQVVDVSVGQELVEGRPGAVLVDGRTGVSEVGDLLGGHEGEGASEVALHRQAAHLGGLVDASQAEVAHLDASRPPSVSMRMFAGLMSRWTIPFAWA